MPKYMIEREPTGAANLSDTQLKEISRNSLAVLKGMGPEIQWLQTKSNQWRKPSWKRVSGFVLIAMIALGMIAPGSHARPAASMAFKLPFDAQMETMALPTGDYTLSIDEMTRNGMIHVYRGTQSVGMLFAQSFESRENEGNHARLICIRQDGKVTVRALQLPGFGTFYFQLPKEFKTPEAQQPQLIETVTVEVNGK